MGSRPMPGVERARFRNQAGGSRVTAPPPRWYDSPEMQARTIFPRRSIGSRGHQMAVACGESYAWKIQSDCGDKGTARPVRVRRRWPDPRTQVQRRPDPAGDGCVARRGETGGLFALGANPVLGQERLHRQPPYQRPRRDGSRSPQISDRKDPARCLVLSAGSYEWRRVGNRRIPMRIVMKSGKPLAIASPWDTWRGPKEGIVKACTIITLQWRAFWERSIRN